LGSERLKIFSINSFQQLRPSMKGGGWTGIQTSENSMRNNPKRVVTSYEVTV